MDQFLVFASNHWALFVALFVIVALLIWSVVYAGLQGISKVSPLDATRLINHEDAVVLDVREDNEYKQGHIINSLHIPLKVLASQTNKLEKYKGRPIIAICRSGQQSVNACTTLRKHGFERVYNLSGGIVAWQNASLPLTKK